MSYSRKPKPMAERFWPKVAKSSDDECWLWQGGLASNGYGAIKEGAPSRKMLSAHRVAYSLAHGPIPDGMVVMHTCDRRRCVNPKHLKLGTQSENILDAVAKGRFLGGKVRQVLTEKQAIEAKKMLREGLLTHAAIAEAFGVNRQVITEISRGKTYQKMEQANV